MARPSFSSLPGLHDSIGKDIPGVQWRKSDIYLRNDYRTSLYRPSKQFQHVDTLIPDPAMTIRERQHTGQQSRDECITRAVTRMTILPTALGLARQLVKTDRHLASALALARERDLAWAEQRRQMQEGSATFSQPVTSPVQVSLLPNVSAPGEEQCEQHDLSDASSRSNAVETIPNPPILGDPAPSVDALFARVNSFAKTRGFGVIKAHGMIRPGQRSRYVLQCHRYGLRGREGVLAFGNESLESRDAEHRHHNHNPSTDAAAHPVHRRLTSPVKATIQSSSRRVGIRARDIGGIVRDHFPDSVYTKRDIYNARARISRENVGGYSSTAALIKLFDDKETPYVAEWAKDEPDRLVGLVWTFSYCIQMWRRFPKVISTKISSYNV
ncbi:hypothetical protein FOZG_17896 [Fusarium oxysporum Fo47]|uniref:Uncharacterized protein n=1 Tax=Fusarium oxysporum Fo47 TaxID=660027 RepID=W9J980_FUSOX|nr:hypothetical protein FOZG_17896 [Fusarium oxysporum Fo47]